MWAYFVDPNWPHKPDEHPFGHSVRVFRRIGSALDNLNSNISALYICSGNYIDEQVNVPNGVSIFAEGSTFGYPIRQI